MSAAGPSNYSFFQIVKKKLETYQKGQGNGRTSTREVVDKKVRIEGKILSFDYYESVYSPMITSKLIEEDTGGTVADDKDGFAGTLKDALPIDGGEEVSFKINTRYGTLKFPNFRKNHMIITGSPSNIDLPQKQTAYIPMISESSIISSNNPVNTIYPEAPISEVVQKILSDKKGLNIPRSKQFIEKTSNNDKIDGNNEPPLDLILELCKKSIPENGKDPGYFFFETSRGFHFRSINGLITEGIEKFDSTSYADEHTYSYFGALESNLDNDENDFKVLLPPVVKKDQDLLQSIRNGQYIVRICTTNTLTQEYKEEILNLLNDTSLGNNETIELDTKNFSKSYTYVINPGSTSSGVSKEVLNSPSVYEPRAIMRYGLLHAQLIEIQIPCNTRLQAGDVIKLKLENITQDNKLEKIYNERRSGFYLILHLCHHFDTDNSYTSLTLSRDTYGLYTSRK